MQYRTVISCLLEYNEIYPQLWELDDLRKAMGLKVLQPFPEPWLKYMAKLKMMWLASPGFWTRIESQEQDWEAVKEGIVPRAWVKGQVHGEGFYVQERVFVSKSQLVTRARKPEHRALDNLVVAESVVVQKVPILNSMEVPLSQKASQELSRFFNSDTLVSPIELLVDQEGDVAMIASVQYESFYLELTQGKSRMRPVFRLPYPVSYGEGWSDGKVLKYYGESRIQVEVQAKPEVIQSLIDVFCWDWAILDSPWAWYDNVRVSTLCDLEHFEKISRVEIRKVKSYDDCSLGWLTELWNSPEDEGKLMLLKALRLEGLEERMGRGGYTSFEDLMISWYDAGEVGDFSSSLPLDLVILERELLLMLWVLKDFPCDIRKYAVNLVHKGLYAKRPVMDLVAGSRIWDMRLPELEKGEDVALYCRKGWDDPQVRRLEKYSPKMMDLVIVSRKRLYRASVVREARDMAFVLPMVETRVDGVFYYHTSIKRPASIFTVWMEGYDADLHSYSFSNSNDQVRGRSESSWSISSTGTWQPIVRAPEERTLDEEQEVEIFEEEGWY